MRIMKNRKRLSHNDLVNEVVRQLLQRFQPSPALIKKRIESLLDRGASCRQPLTDIRVPRGAHRRRQTNAAHGRAPCIPVCSLVSIVGGRESRSPTCLTDGAAAACGAGGSVGSTGDTARLLGFGHAQGGT